MQRPGNINVMGRLYLEINVIYISNHKIRVTDNNRSILNICMNKHLLLWLPATEFIFYYEKKYKELI